MTDTPRTFDLGNWDQKLRDAWNDFAGGYKTDPLPGNLQVADFFWHARDPEIAEKDRRIAELERQLIVKGELFKALSASEFDLRQRIAELENSEALRSQIDDLMSKLNKENIKVFALQARIDAVMALPDQWESEVVGGEGGDLFRCAAQLRVAALGEPAAERGPGGKP